MADAGEGNRRGSFVGGEDEQLISIAREREKELNSARNMFVGTLKDVYEFIFRCLFQSQLVYLLSYPELTKKCTTAANN